MHGSEKPTLLATVVATFGAALIGAFAAMFFAAPIGQEAVNEVTGTGLNVSPDLPITTVAAIVVGSAIGAIALRFMLGALSGYDVSLGGAFVALLAGKLVFMGIVWAVPEAGAGFAPFLGPELSLAGVPQLLVAALIVQMNATEPVRAIP